MFFSTNTYSAGFFFFPLSNEMILKRLKKVCKLLECVNVILTLVMKVGNNFTGFFWRTTKELKGCLRTLEPAALLWKQLSRAILSKLYFCKGPEYFFQSKPKSILGQNVYFFFSNTLSLEQLFSYVVSYQTSVAVIRLHSNALHIHLFLDNASSTYFWYYFFPFLFLVQLKNFLLDALTFQYLVILDFGPFPSYSCASRPVLSPLMSSYFWTAPFCIPSRFLDVIFQGNL